MSDRVEKSDVAIIPISTGVFRMNALNFMTTFIFRYAWIWILVLSLLGLAGIITGVIIDIRWFILGLMVILVIAPMICAFLYYMYALRRECYINTTDHSITFNEDGITASLSFDDEKTREEFFPYSDLKPFQVGNKSIIFPFNGYKKGFIWIPFSTFPDEETLQCALSLIDSKISPSMIE